MEPAAGIEPANLLFTKQSLYQLSYAGDRDVKEGGGPPGT